MRAFIALCVLLLTFAVGAAEERSHAAVLDAYHHLSATAVEAQRATTPPADLPSWTRIDVSAKARSASFGHTTTLLVAPSGDTFYVEYGRSTNRPRRLFGPFSVAK